MKFVCRIICRGLCACRNTKMGKTEDQCLETSAHGDLDDDQDDWEPEDHIKIEKYYEKYKCVFRAHEAYMKQIISIANSPVYSYIHRIQWAMRELRIVAEISQESFLLEVSGDFDREKLFRQIHQTLCLILSAGRYGENIALQPICFGLPVYWKGMSMFAVDLGITLPWKLETDLKKIPFDNFHKRLVSASKALDKVDNRTAWAEHTWDEEVLARKRREKEKANGGDPRHWSWKHPETLTEFLSRKGKEMDKKIQRNVRNMEQKIENLEATQQLTEEKDTHDTLNKELGIWDKTQWVQRWLDLCPRKLKSLIPEKIQSKKIAPSKEEQERYDKFKWLAEDEETVSTQQRLKSEITTWHNVNGEKLKTNETGVPSRKRSRWELSQDPNKQNTGLQKIAQAYRNFRETDEERQEIRTWQMSPKSKSPNIRKSRRRRAYFPYSRNKEHHILKQMRRSELLSANAEKQEDIEVHWNNTSPGVSRMDKRPIILQQQACIRAQVKKHSENITKCLMDIAHEKMPTSIEQIEQNIGRLTTQDNHQESMHPGMDNPVYEEMGTESGVQQTRTNIVYELSSVSSESSGLEDITDDTSDWSKTTEKYGDDTRMEVDQPEELNGGTYENTTTETTEEQKLYHFAL